MWWLAKPGMVVALIWYMSQKYGTRTIFAVGKLGGGTVSNTTAVDYGEDPDPTGTLNQLYNADTFGDALDALGSSAGSPTLQRGTVTQPTSSTPTRLTAAARFSPRTIGGGRY